MKIVEQITTTKGAYLPGAGGAVSLNIQMREGAESALISISEGERETFMRLDNEDLKRIYLLLSDHLIGARKTTAKKTIT
tara:strand:+ start:708 stop:947 length:240 start_codon:yes stop_codon:yes gene_type:complete